MPSAVTPCGKRATCNSGLMARAISAITSSLGRPMLPIVAPAWRLKLAMSKVSKSATRTLPMPIRTSVSRWTPPTPPMPAMATLLPRNAACSASVTQPMLRSNAWA